MVYCHVQLLSYKAGTDREDLERIHPKKTPNKSRGSPDLPISQGENQKRLARRGRREILKYLPKVRGVQYFGLGVQL